jgi:hypothetical protein
MSLPEDLEALRGVYDEWARGEFWNADVYDPEIVFVLGDSLPDPGTYKGIEGLDKRFRGWLESWRELRFELEELIPLVSGSSSSSTKRASAEQAVSGQRWRAATSGPRAMARPYALRFI